jgi:hypothetical protein
MTERLKSNAKTSPKEWRINHLPPESKTAALRYGYGVIVVSGARNYNTMKLRGNVFFKKECGLLQNCS